MKKKQMASLLFITLVWLTTCGFVSWGDAASAGITEIVEPMTSEDFEAYEIMEAWDVSMYRKALPAFCFQSCQIQHHLHTDSNHR